MRKLVILTQLPDWLVSSLNKSVTTHRNNALNAHQTGIFLPVGNHFNAWRQLPFSNAKSLLGSELPFAFYVMEAQNRLEFNLEAFAILAGTIQHQGCLYLVCPNWANLENLIDQDALRWNENHAIPCPAFYQYFKQLVSEFGFSVERNLPALPITSGQKSDELYKLNENNLTPEQQIIFENLPLAEQDVHLITAPRGRGKSTLAGRLAQSLAQTNSVLITARSRAAITNFWQMTNESNIEFIAPDALLEQVENKNISPHQWLFIDEAASLPLPSLHQFCAYFDKAILTTTTHNYEGTGRGFSLKFLSQLKRDAKHWKLTQPLRWQENDLLEAFINALLLLDEVQNTDILPTAELAYSAQPMNLAEKMAFYKLLAQAHYKTTPTDLRRLFDGQNQQYFRVQNPQKNQLLGGIWALNEGGLDAELAQAIWRGERRPQGNLVAQYLCFQGNLPQACELHSVRISRIAITPSLQNQGIGKRLISEFILQICQQKQPLVDFVSVSFGMTESLLHFWQQCGFKLVQITPTKEASSGYPSAMMLYPLTEQGKMFCDKAVKMFERDQALANQVQPLNETDWENIHGFANAKRTVTACYVSLKRLYLSDTLQFSFLSAIFLQPKSAKYSKSQIEEWRKSVREKLF